MKRKIKFPETVPCIILNDGFFLQWCCGCKARHIWHFHIVREKDPSEDYVVLSVARDFTAEKLRRMYEKGNKSKIETLIKKT